MLLSALLAATALVLPALVESTALTTPISPNERLCFYADVDKAGEKIGVRRLPPRVIHRMCMLMMMCPHFANYWHDSSTLQYVLL